MAPTKKDDLKEEDRITAVLVAETFNNNFQPLITYQSLALIPLVNTPIIDYSLDWLQRNLVDETIIYCCTQPHSDEIRDHCRQWCLKFGNVMKVTVISSENCTSLGDAMRDLYSKSLLKTNFILLNGAVVGNLDLKILLKNYKSVQKKDPNCVMSSVYLKRRQRNKVDRSRVVDLIIDSKTGKLLSHSRSGRKSKLVVHTEILQSASKVRLMPQLEDPSLSICSQMIPSLFSDNFDYGTRDSLIQGVIEQEELLGCTIHAQVVDEGYAAVISSFAAYDEISNSVIKREAYPSVPERSLSSQRIRYLFHPFTGSYWDSSAKFHKKSIKENVVIDAGTSIDPRCKIKDSVVGKHCTVRENVTINGSYILSNDAIYKGCILDSCFISDNVKLLPGVHLESGVILGPQTVLGPNLKVDRCVKLVHESTDSTDEIDHLVCGNEGKAYHYVASDDEIEDSLTPVWGALDQGGERGDGDLSDLDSDLSDDEDALDGGQHRGADDLSSDEEREIEFVREVKDSLLNAYKTNSAIDNVILEVNSSRHAYNVTMENVLITINKGILSVVEDSNKVRLKDEELWQSVNEGLHTFADLIRNYVKKARDQMTVLQAVEEAINENTRLLPLTQRILYELNQVLEILDDEVIIFWFTRNGFQTPAFPLIARSISKFIIWLQADDHEDESDDE